MKYLTQNWDSKFDGVLYFIQRLEEMLFHYSDDIVKAPVHNSATLIKEYGQISKDKSIQPYHLDIVAEELIESLKTDSIIKEKIGADKVQRLISSLRVQKEDTIHILNGLIPLIDYHNWCVDYIIKHIKNPNAKNEIRDGLRSWISTIIWGGYSPEYVYRYLRNSFENEVDEPLESIDHFIRHFDMTKNKYRVYFLFMGNLIPYKEMIRTRLDVNFEDDGFFKLVEKRDNKGFVGYVDIEEIDPYAAANLAYRRLDIFIGFYRVLSNRKKALLAKNATVRDLNTVELIKMPVFSKGYRAIEIEPKTSLHDTIDKAVIGCQNKPQSTYYSIHKMITLHNMALRQDDLADGFVNLWSILEVACKEVDKTSKIESVIDGILPILQNDFFGKYFISLDDDLRYALSKEDYRQYLHHVQGDIDNIGRLMCFVLLDEYEQDREDIFAKLSGYPNIRQKIYKLYTLKNEKQKLYKVCEKYARRLKWHIYRLYRVRNGIVHAGQENKDIQVLGEHLHIYCDGVILEIITKLASSVYLTKINDVLLDTKLLVETKKERFSNNESITYDDIEFLLKRSFV